MILKSIYFYQLVTLFLLLVVNIIETFKINCNIDLISNTVGISTSILFLNFIIMYYLKAPKYSYLPIIGLLFINILNILDTFYNFQYSIYYDILESVLILFILFWSLLLLYRKDKNVRKFLA